MRDGEPRHSVADLMPIHPPVEEPPPSGEAIIPEQLEEAKA
jgi:hypothetical protein